MLAALRKDSIFGSQKNPIKCKTLFPQWNLKTCKFCGASNTEEQFHFPNKIITAVHRFLEDSLFAAPDYYHNHICKNEILIPKRYIMQLCWYKIKLRAEVMTFTVANSSFQLNLVFMADIRPGFCSRLLL